MFHSKYYVPFSAHSASAAVIIHGYNSFIFFRIVVWHFPKEQLTIRCSQPQFAPLQWDAIYPAHVSNLLSSSKAGISPTASSWARNDCRSILVHAYQSPSLASITRRKLCEDGWVIHPEMQKRLLTPTPSFSIYGSHIFGGQWTRILGNLGGEPWAFAGAVLIPRSMIAYRGCMNCSQVHAVHSNHCEEKSHHCSPAHTKNGSGDWTTEMIA